VFGRLFRKKGGAVPPSSAANLSHALDRADAGMPLTITQALQTGLQHHQAGRFDDAKRAYGHALTIDADNFDALHLMGLTAHQTGDSRRAAELIEKAVAINPSNAIVFSNLAEVYRVLGRPGDAQTCCEKALSLEPNYADAHYNLGLLHEKRGRRTEARACYTKALSLKPELVEAFNRLGSLLKGEGKLNEARDCYERALAQRPDFVNALNNLGTVLADQGRPDQALRCYQRALELSPALVEAHVNLGALLRDEGKLDEALACYRRAVELGPGFAYAHYGLGHVLADQDKSADALACFQTALSLDPQLVEARWAHVMTQLPSVYELDADPEQYRAAFVRELDRLIAWFEANPAAEGARAVGTQQPFMLAYQEWENRGLLAKYGGLCAQLMRGWQQREGLATTPASFRRPSVPANAGGDSNQERIRVGIVSTHIRKHSEWQAILKGWFRHLDKSRFELQVFYLKSRVDEETAFAKSHASYFAQGERSLKEWVETILSRQPDVLVYPEIGTDPMSFRLASMRLAPVQVTTWGYPETSGLPTIDYYLSSEDFEAADAQSAYNEQLVVLPNLGCAYEPIASEIGKPDYSSLGIRQSSPILLCAGTPYKYAPQHDHVFVDIARKLGPCQFVFFFTSRFPELTEKLRRRLEVVFSRAGLPFDQHVVFISLLPRPDFYGLMRRADVYLDTIGFSGFNTAMQAIACGLPIVTREGRFMRGRFASGILRRMDLAELVADSKQRYIDLAIKVASDSGYRLELRSRIEASGPMLHNDVAPIRALEEFLWRTVKGN
jgi:predicted O-linked N-acetylglucosamine transferase (SPINDLY family)